MVKKVNAVEDLANLNRAERRRAAKVGVELTDAEKVTIAILIERVNLLQRQLQECQMALSANIGQAVTNRGLDTLKFGVNLAAGKILPIEQPGDNPEGNGASPSA